MELYSKLPQEEPIMSQHWLSSWLALSSLHVFETVQPNLSKAHKHHHWLQQTRCTPLMQPEDQLLIEITMLHLCVKSNSSPPREVPISFSRTQTASYGLHHQMAPPLWLPRYLAQGIKLTVVHWYELHQVQALVTKSSAANRPGWVIEVLPAHKIQNFKTLK